MSLEVGRKGRCSVDSPVIWGSARWQPGGVSLGWRSKGPGLGGRGMVVGLQTAGCTGPVSLRAALVGKRGQNVAVVFLESEGWCRDQVKAGRSKVTAG